MDRKLQYLFTGIHGRFRIVAKNNRTAWKELKRRIRRKPDRDSWNMHVLTPEDMSNRGAK